MNDSLNNTPELDSFETALLTELRREVAEHPAKRPALTPRRRSRRGLRLVALAATGVVASVVAVFGLGGSGGSAAYAVDQNSAGDVTITVHRLDDAAGLEKALRAKGIDADVSYDGSGFGRPFGVGPDGKPLSEDEVPPPSTGEPGEGTQVESGQVPGQVEGQGPTLTQSGPKAPGADGDQPCGLGADPATLTQEGSDWVLRIPADSPLQDRHVEIGTDSSGGLSVAYAGDEQGSLCGMVSMTRGTPPA